MALVNLFVAGHPRSGTGTIDGWLTAHPDIFMGPKELHYFGQDLDFNIPKRTKKNYNLIKNEISIGFAAPMYWNCKGLGVIVKLYEQLIRKEKNFKLHLAGAGPQAQKLKI